MAVLNYISSFVQVVRAGSFSQAARELKVPKSTLSHQVSLLEEQLGVSLLQRTTRQMRLTDAGKAYFDICSKTLDDFTHASNIIKERQDDIAGSIKITAPVEVAHYQLTDALTQFKKLYPQISIDLDLTDRVVDIVSEGFDLALRAGLLKDSSLKSKKISTGEIGLYASPEYLELKGTPKHPKDLENHVLLIYAPKARQTGWQLSSQSQKLKVEAKSYIRANSFLLLKNIALKHVGVTLLPGFLAEPDVEAGKLVRVLGNWWSEKSALTIVYPAQSHMPQRVRLLINFLSKELTSKKW